MKGSSRHQTRECREIAMLVVFVNIPLLRAYMAAHLEMISKVNRSQGGEFQTLTERGRRERLCEISRKGSLTEHRPLGHLHLTSGKGKIIYG